MESNPFHEVGNLFPGETSVESIEAGTTVGNALSLMVGKRYSQLPVMDHGVVRGVFSLWSLAEHLAITPSLTVHEMLVEDLMEQLPSVTVTDSLHSVLNRLKEHEALLVNSEHGLQAVVTPLLVLDYFYKVASPFILLQEIELALRSLIELCATGEKLKSCIDHALATYYRNKNDQVPTDLQEMTFEDYRLIIISKANWTVFEGVLGQNRNLVSTKLEQIRKIRNDMFHFRDSAPAVLQYQILANVRSWLLDKTLQTQV